MEQKWSSSASKLLYPAVLSFVVCIQDQISYSIHIPPLEKYSSYSSLSKVEENSVSYVMTYNKLS